MLNEKIVDFGEYCPKCKHWKVSEADEPCRECLTVGGRDDGSRKPINFDGGRKGK